MKIAVLVLGVLLGAVTTAIAGWKLYPSVDNESLANTTEERRGTILQRHLRVLDDGTIVHAYKGRLGGIRWQKRSGELLEYARTEIDTSRAIRLREETESPEGRRKIYAEEPIVLTMTGIYGKSQGLVLTHELFVKNSYVRIIQILDDNLRVTGVWEDQWPMRIKKYAVEDRDPFAIQEGGKVIASGEPGEFIVYSWGGDILERLAVPAVFNLSRAIQPLRLSDDDRKYLSQGDAAMMERQRNHLAAVDTGLLEEREKGLPRPIALNGNCAPSRLRDMVSLGQNIVLVLGDKGETCRLDLADRTITTLDINGWKMIGEGELPYQIRSEDGYLFQMTEYRMLVIEKGRRPAVVSETRLPPGVGGPKAAWDVIHVPIGDSDEAKNRKKWKLVYFDMIKGGTAELALLLEK